MRNLLTLSALLSLGTVCAIPDDFHGIGSASVPINPVLDLPGLAREAVNWGAAIIGAVDKSGQDGTAKLNSASQGFGEALAQNIDSLEARAGALGAILNAPGINEFEHGLVIKAVEFGGTELAKLLSVAVQNIFNALRSVGHI